MKREQAYLVLQRHKELEWGQEEQGTGTFETSHYQLTDQGDEKKK